MTDFSKKWANEDRRGRRNEPSNRFYSLIVTFTLGFMFGVGLVYYFGLP